MRIHDVPPLFRMLIFILAVIALTRKMPPKPPEDGLEAVNPSIPDGNNSTGRSELLSVIATDGVMLTPSTDKKCIDSIIFLIISRIYLV